MDGSQGTSAKEILWLSCREKSCCHNTKVIISGRDMCRISQALELAPWDFTMYSEAPERAVDGFQLAPGGPAYQVVLAKRGEIGPRGAPCTFLWKLADGHAQCGLGALRPLICHSYPALVVDGMLCVESSPCTCRRWSLLDLDHAQEMARLELLLEEADEYKRIVDAWNADLATWPGEHTYLEFCAYVLDAYASLEGATA